MRKLGMLVSLTSMRFVQGVRHAIARISGRTRSNGVRIVVAEGTKILLVRHYHAPWIWALPGGGIDADESPSAAAIREIKEETGLEIILFDGGAGSFKNRWGGDTHVFYTKHFTGTTSPTVYFEILECRWFDIHAIPEEIFPTHKKIIDAYKSVQNSST